MKLALRYAILALIATAANIGAQDLYLRYTMWVYPVVASVFIGTGVGLVVKYILDKRYIFRFRSKNAVQDGFTFFLYTAMGLLTTLIFWGFEFGFDHVFASKDMRYLGAVIGLSIGYLTKYQLDKRFVFTSSRRRK